MEVVLLLFAERDLQEEYNWVEEHPSRERAVFPAGCTLEA
jgi:hypothetical protein